MTTSANPPETTPTSTAQPPAPSALPATRAPSDKPAIPVKIGVTPTNIDEAWRLSQYLANSDLVPKQYRKVPADVLVAIQMGAELGLAPMQALQSIAVINGRATVWGDALLAVIVASPLYENHDEYFEVDGKRVAGLTVDDLKKDSTTAVCTFTRHNKPEPVTARFSIGQAKKAGLHGKEGPWQTYPDRMLKMRARGFAARDAFADLLRGIKAAEEVYDVDDEDRRELPPVREVRRVSATPPAADAPVAAVVDDVVTVGPVAVKGVETFLGGATLTLVDGTQIDLLDPADVADLTKAAGSPAPYVFTCTRGADKVLQLRSYRCAD